MVRAFGAKYYFKLNSIWCRNERGFVTTEQGLDKLCRCTRATLNGGEQYDHDHQEGAYRDYHQDTDDPVLQGADAWDLLCGGFHWQLLLN